MRDILDVLVRYHPHRRGAGVTRGRHGDDRNGSATNRERAATASGHAATTIRR